MRRTIWLLLAIGWSLSWDPLYAENHFFVAPDGRDENPGTLAQPFASLEQAREAIRELRRTQPGAERVTVFLRGGTYFIKRPLVLSSRDAGTETAPLTFCAYQKEEPIISGGQRIVGWKKKKVNKLDLWAVSLPEVKSGAWSFHQLWVDEERRQPARHPNQGYLQVQRLPKRTPESKWTDGDDQFSYRAGDLPAGLRADGEVVVMNRWVESRLPIKTVDATQHTLHFSKRSVFRLDDNDLYYVENSLAALDQPGEWYLDRNEGMLYYLPKLGEEIDKFTVIAPRLSQLVRFEGEVDSARFVEHIHWRNITFSHTEWYFPADFKSTWPHPAAGAAVGGFPQAAVGVPGAVFGQGCRFLKLENCRLIHLGTYGIEWAQACHDNQVIQCEIGDLGAGGIKIGEPVLRDQASEQTHDQGIFDCHIYDGGRLFHSAIGIWIGQSYNNQLIHNHIHDFYYTGISIGWTWGYGPALSRGNVVECNHVHHIGVLSNGDGPILSDMAAIYTLGMQPGTLIRLNLFHDIAGLRYGGWGIYFDEGSTYILAENNIVCRTTHGGFHQHYGRENIVRNNIFFKARDFQIQRSRAEDHTSFSFERNIVYWDQGKLLEGKFSDDHFFFDHNLYWQSKSAAIRFDTLTFSAWQEKGMDRHSLIADPLFLAPEKDDFRLQPQSPAFALGFEPIPVYKIFQPWHRVGADSIVVPSKARLLYQQEIINLLRHDSTTAQDLHHAVDEVANAGVTTYILSPFLGQRAAFPSQIATMYQYPEGSAKGLTSDSVCRRLHNNLHRLTDNGQDVIELLLRRAQLRGMEGFVSLHMNELEDADQPNSPLLDAFWKSHHAFRIGDRKDKGALALNYAIPQVREYYLALLRELGQRYSLDGIELDFMRYPYYFPDAEENRQAYGQIMSEFVGQVRALTKEMAGRNHKELLLSVRVPSTLKGCQWVGLNVGEWCQSGLIDFVTVSPYMSTETDMPIFEFKAVCDDLPVYAAMERTLGPRFMTTGNIRAAAVALYDYGADGMYCSNYYRGQETLPLLDWSVLKEIRQPDSLANRSKLYGLAPSQSPIAPFSLTSPLPVTLSAGQPRALSLRTPEVKTAQQVLLWLEAKEKLDSDRLYVEFNDQSLDRLFVADGPLPLPRSLQPAIAASDRALVFEVPPEWLQPNNQILIVSESKITLEYVYLSVIHSNGL